MVRFLHTADWQIGMAAKQAGAKAKEVREQRFRSAREIARLAREKKVDFVLLAGDTFEYESPGRVDVKKTVDILNVFAPIPVFVLPGNHDPLRPGAVWESAEWREAGEHVVLLREPAEFPIKGLDVVLYPCPLTQKESKEDATGWIPARQAGDPRVRIGVGHGGLDFREEFNFPIASDRAMKSGLDYLALGDWHSTYGHTTSKATWYSGTHETTKFGEKESGNVLIVELESGSPPQVETIRTGGLRWEEYAPFIETPADVRKLDAAIKAGGELEKLLVRVRPDISSDAAEDTRSALETLRMEVEEDALVCDWEQDEAAALVLDDVAIPPGTLQEADEVLAAGQVAELLPFEPSGDELAAARLLLRKVLKEVAS